MINPFVNEQNRDGVISYGLSSYGYDARVSNQFKVFTNVNNAIVDPKNFSEDSFIEREGVASGCLLNVESVWTFKAFCCSLVEVPNKDGMFSK